MKLAHAFHLLPMTLKYGDCVHFTSPTVSSYCAIAETRELSHRWRGRYEGVVMSKYGVNRIPDDVTITPYS